ncbi:hypothetical protein QGM61_07695 [Pseudohongiella sp. SYSU M77423]|uniref:hypothetical protein n=1 Tax=Pseudohongiella sp. SYSU M77423 TaxID=3042312 RepID=UPI002481026A|nr:hypothetical protein [Pseudohongiella sp. SYSU M77423]MDH7943701.1 hypothetical protein [Pseudohongiella sp. SYSU M77423]
METSLPNIISALSVLFGVAVFHMGANANKVKEALAIDKPPKEQVTTLKKQRSTIATTILLSSMPNFAMLGAISFVMLPQAVKHISTTKLSLINFDFMITLYQIIWIIVAFYTIASMVNIIKLVNKWFEFGKV